jgi:hypothetical protein
VCGRPSNDGSRVIAPDNIHYSFDLVGTAGDLSGSLSELTETCAGIYLANPRGLVAFVHAVTAPSALRLVAPYLTAAEARGAARYAWQACAAIYAWYATVPPPALASLTPPPATPDVLMDRAVAAGGAHTIKFTEACLREYALHPAPYTCWQPTTPPNG